MPCLCLHADKLKYFGIFSDYFIGDWKKDINFSVQSVNKPFDWHVLGEIIEYQTRAKKGEKYTIWTIIMHLTEKRILLKRKHKSGNDGEHIETLSTPLLYEIT